jgi:hypothetical protein
VGKNSYLKSDTTVELSPYIVAVPTSNLDITRAAKAGPKASHLVASLAYTGTDNLTHGSQPSSAKVIPMPAYCPVKDPSQQITHLNSLPILIGSGSESNSVTSTSYSL